MYRYSLLLLNYSLSSQLYIYTNGFLSFNFVSFGFFSRIPSIAELNASCLITITTQSRAIIFVDGVQLYSEV